MLTGSAMTQAVGSKHLVGNEFQKSAVRSDSIGRIALRSHQAARVAGAENEGGGSIPTTGDL